MLVFDAEGKTVNREIDLRGRPDLSVVRALSDTEARKRAAKVRSVGKTKPAENRNAMFLPVPGAG